MNQWHQAKRGFERLNQRERGLIFLAGPLVLVMLSFTLLLEPLWLQQQRHEQKSRQLQTQMMELQAQQLTLSDRLSLDVNQADYNAIAALEAEIADKQQALGQRVMGLILPEHMPAVLAQMLVSTRQVELVSLQSHPAKALSEELYQHGLQLVLRGDYFALMQVLSAMEGLPQQFYWHSVDYQVDEYPRGLMKLQIYTLGTEKELIRVGTRTAAG